MQWIAEHKLGLWAFAVATAYIPGIMSAAFSPRWIVIALGVPIMANLTLERIPPAVRFALIAGMAWAAASLMVSPAPLAGGLELFFAIMLCGVMVVASQCEKIDQIIIGIGYGLVVSTIVCVFFLAGYPLVNQASQNPAGLFYNSEILAELSAPVLVWMVIKRQWVLSTLIAFPLAMSSSKIALLGITAGLLYGFRFRSRLLSAAFVVCAVLAFLLMVAILCLDGGRVSSIGTRAVIWLATLMSATPLGNGLGWFEAAHPAQQFAHSEIIQGVAELGVGVIFFAFIPGYILWKNRGSNADRAAFIVICIEGAISFPLHIPATAFLAAVLTGFLARDCACLRSAGLERGIQNGEDRERCSDYTGTGYDGSGWRGGIIPVRSKAA